MLWITVLVTAVSLLGMTPLSCGASGGASGQTDPRGTGAEMAVRAPGHELAFLNDGKLAGKTQNATLWIWSLDTKKMRQVAKGYGATAFCFSPDGNRIAFLGYRAAEKYESAIPYNSSMELWLHDLRTGKTRQVTTGLWAPLGCSIAWRPGAEQVAVPRQIIYRISKAMSPPEGDGGLWLVDVNTGETIQVIGDSDSESTVHWSPRFNADGSMLASIPVGVVDVSPAVTIHRLGGPASGLATCSEWGQGTSDLLLGMTTAKCIFGIDETRHVEKGPGGIWKWEVSGSLKPQSADLLFEKGQGIHSMAINHDHKRLAYLSESGLWLRDLGKANRSRLLALKDLPSLRGVVEGKREEAEVPSGNTSEMFSNLSWSADDRYISCRTYGLNGQLLVIDLIANQTIRPPSPIGSSFAAWRPAGKP